MQSWSLQTRGAADKVCSFRMSEAPATGSAGRSAKLPIPAPTRRKAAQTPAPEQASPTLQAASGVHLPA